MMIGPQPQYQLLAQLQAQPQTSQRRRRQRVMIQQQQHHWWSWCLLGSCWWLGLFTNENGTNLCLAFGGTARRPMRGCHSGHRHTPYCPTTSSATTVTLQLATSSRDLKKDRKSGKGGKSKKSTTSKSSDEQQEGIVQRLARAAARAASLQTARNETTTSGVSTHVESATAAKVLPHPPGNLRQLTRAIDQQLQDKQQRRDPTFTDGLVQQARDSMSSLLGYNDKVMKPSFSATMGLSRPPPRRRHVAVVFGKPLLHDQVTVEYASRLRSLAKMVMENDHEDNNEPVSLICFCGGGTRTAPGNLVSDADAGYIFFRHLCAAQGISLDSIDIFLDRTGTDEGMALKHVTQHVLQHHVPQWLATSEQVEPRQKVTDDHGMPRRVPRKKIHVHFTLISTEYHLCNLNDIHHRSPKQSLLRPMEVMKKEYGGTEAVSTTKALDRSYHNLANIEEEEEEEAELWDDDQFAERLYARMEQKTQRNGIVETSWSYRYATYPYVYAKDEAMAFMGRCYLLGEELMPLLVNLRGIVEDKEFFQRDNYLGLASIRRSFVTHMEELYKTTPTSLRTDVRQAEDMIVVLEGAVLSLGRCIDLVRPAGLLVSSVPKADFVKALRALEHCMSQVRTYCDPDRPLDPKEWGRLTPNEEYDED